MFDSIRSAIHCNQLAIFSSVCQKKNQWNKKKNLKIIHNNSMNRKTKDSVKIENQNCFLWQITYRLMFARIGKIRKLDHKKNCQTSNQIVITNRMANVFFLFDFIVKWLIVIAFFFSTCILSFFLWLLALFAWRRKIEINNKVQHTRFPLNEQQFSSIIFSFAIYVAFFFSSDFDKSHSPFD